MAWPFRLACLVANGIFTVLHPAFQSSWPPMAGFALSVGVNAVLFVLPASGWLLASPGTRGLGMRVLRSVALSTIALLGVLAMFQLVGVTASATGVWNALWVVTNAGFLYAAFRRPRSTWRRSLLRREVVVGVTLFLASYGLFYWGATRVVPPQDDHDLEVLATGYGLLNRFEPLLLTDRGGVYFFAHPPLLHFYVAGSFLLQGSADELAFYDKASQVARSARDRGDAAEASRVGKEQLEQIYAHYRAHPSQRASRTPNLFFASMAVALLGIWAGRISRRWWMGVLVAIAYATNPEVFVRSSYGGYFAIGSFVCVTMLLAADRWWRWPDRRRATLLVLAAAFAALADHKLIVLPAALVLHDLFEHWRGRTGARRGISWIHPSAVGFGLGLCAFWTWGLLIAPAAFIRDHVLDHFVERIVHVNPLGYGGYATPVGLWMELLAHTGYVIVPAGLVFLTLDLWQGRAGSASRWREARGAWLTWIVLAGAAFTVIDWRMTKHVIPLLLPMVLGLVPDRRARSWRMVVPCLVMVAAVVSNGLAISGLARDFAAFTVTPAW